MTSPPPIEQILVLSTAHIEQRVARMLPDRPIPTSRAPQWWPSWTRAEGWMFYVPPRGSADDRYAHAPMCLKACVNLARKAGCCWLMLDADGSVVDDLPTWEWDTALAEATLITAPRCVVCGRPSKEKDRCGYHTGHFQPADLGDRKRRRM